jgi:hypothetical protein
MDLIMKVDDTVVQTGAGIRTVHQAPDVVLPPQV